MVEVAALNGNMAEVQGRLLARHAWADIADDTEDELAEAPLQVEDISKAGKDGGKRSRKKRRRAAAAAAAAVAQPADFEHAVTDGPQAEQQTEGKANLTTEAPMEAKATAAATSVAKADLSLKVEEQAEVKAHATAEAAPSAVEGAYLMAVIGGMVSPSASDLKEILDAAGIAVDQESLDRVIAKMDGKQVQLQQLATQALSAFGGSLSRSLRGSCL